MTSVLALVGLGSVPAARADGLDSLSQTRCERVHGYIGKIQFDDSLRRDVPLSKANTVFRAIGEAEGRLRFARGEYGKIPARNHKHPVVVAAAKEIARAEAYVADLKRVYEDLERRQAQEQAAKEEQRRQQWEQEQADQARKQADEAAQRERIGAAMSGFSNEYWKHKQRLEWLKPFWEDPGYTLGYGDTTIAEAKQAFAEIHEGCTGRHKEIANPANEWNKTYRWWCEISAQGDEVLKRMVGNWIRQREQVFVDAFKKQAEDLAGCNGYLKYFDWDYFKDPGKVKAEWLARYRADAKAVGIELSDAMFAEADAALAALLPKIVEAAKAWPFDPYGKPAKDAWVKKQYESGWPGAKVKKTYHTDKDWRVYKNNLGVNLYRTKRGTVLVEVKGEPWCRESTFTIVQDAKGRSGFGKSYFEHGVLAGGRVVSCK